MNDRKRDEVQAEVNGLFTGRDQATDAAMRRAYELGLAAHRFQHSGPTTADEEGGPIVLPPPPGQTSGPG